MKTTGLLVAAALLAVAFFAGGWAARGQQRSPNDDMWWAHIPNADFYGVRLSRDPSCRGDLETCIKALDCQANLAISPMRKETLGNPACQAAWRSHPAVLQPANPSIREDPNSPKMRALRAESDKLTVQSIADSMCESVSGTPGTDGKCYALHEHMPRGVTPRKAALQP